MIKFNPLPSAPDVYSQSEESLFRRGVENSLIATYAELEGAISAQQGEASPASKRETLLLREVGSQIGPKAFPNRSVSVLDFGARPLFEGGGQSLEDQSVRIQAAIDFCQLNDLVLEFPVQQLFVCNNTLNIFIGVPVTLSSVVTGLSAGFNPADGTALTFSGGSSGTVFSWDSTTSTLVWRKNIGASTPLVTETVTSGADTATLGTVVDDLIGAYDKRKSMIINGNGSILRPFVDIGGPVLNVVGYNSGAQMENYGTNG